MAACDDIAPDSLLSTPTCSIVPPISPDTCLQVSPSICGLQAPQGPQAIQGGVQAYTPCCGSQIQGYTGVQAVITSITCIQGSLIYTVAEWTIEKGLVKHIA